MGAREEILEALTSLCRRTGSDTFTPQDVVDELARRGSWYSPSTIRTHVVSRMCANAPNNHGTVYRDLERVGDGRYKRRG